MLLVTVLFLKCTWSTCCKVFSLFIADERATNRRELDTKDKNFGSFSLVD